MNFFENYVAYIKDNPRHYWFKRKLYGWGWVPATKEGWWVILGYIVAIILISIPLDSNPNPSIFDITLFLGGIALSIAAVIWLCFKKGETPRWQWGIKR